MLKAFSASSDDVVASSIGVANFCTEASDSPSFVRNADAELSKAFSLLWHHVYAASIATALLNALGPVLLYVSGRMIAGPIPGAIASLLLAFSPFFVGIFPNG